MAHQRLFAGMLLLLFAGAGGVFVLLLQGGGQPKVAREAFVAGVSVEEGREKEMFEAGLQTEDFSESKVGLSPPPLAPQPNPQPALAPSPEPVPAPAPEPAPQPQPPPPPPAPVPTPAPSPSAPQPQPPPAPEPSPPAPPPPAPGKININTASHEELQLITGVGPVIAQRIIDYREDVSLFYAIEDIKKVSGIGEVTFEKMKDGITVGDVSAPEPAPVPPPPPPPPALSLEPSPSIPSGKININTAGYEELQEITGVGPVIAQRIIDYRGENGSFETIEEMKNVKGIGDKTFEKMRDEITV